MATCVLRSIIDVTKDGEWGKAEPFDPSVVMAVIRGTDFAGARVGVLENVPVRHIPEHIAARKQLQAFDILIETAGGIKDQPTGRTLFIKPSLLSKSALPLTCASFARFIRIDPTKADPEYVFWLLQSLYYGGAITQYHTQHTGVARFQFTTFAEREQLTLPDATTQRRIASILSAYDDLIENNTRRIKILEEMAQMLYREWFVHFRFPGHENVRMVSSELGPIPEGWSVKSLKDVASYIGRGISPKYDGEADGWVLNQKCIRDHRLTLHPSRRQSKPVPTDKVVRKGDILINSTGVGTLGRVTQVHRDLKNFTVDSHITIVRPAKYADYFGEVAIQLEPEFEAAGVGSTGQTELGRERIAGTQFVYPPENFRVQFSEQAATFHQLSTCLLQKNENLRTTRDLLLPKLISGEIPVEAANGAAAELTEEIALHT